MERKFRVERPDFKVRVDDQSLGSCKSKSAARFRKERSPIAANVSLLHSSNLCW
jgi:hypothetical protein